MGYSLTAADKVDRLEAEFKSAGDWLEHNRDLSGTEGFASMLKEFSRIKSALREARLNLYQEAYKGLDVVDLRREADRIHCQAAELKRKFYLGESQRILETSKWLQRLARTKEIEGPSFDNVCGRRAHLFASGAERLMDQKRDIDKRLKRWPGKVNSKKYRDLRKEASALENGARKMFEIACKESEAGKWLASQKGI